MPDDICWCCGYDELAPQSELCTECHEENLSIQAELAKVAA